MTVWPALLAITGALFAADATEAARRVAEAESASPWFWSPSLEGMGEIPYNYEAMVTREFRDHKGRPVPMRGADPLGAWRSLRIDHVALDWGSHQLCLEVDGRSPCPAAWTAEFERQAQRRTALGEEGRVRADRARQARREKARTFWAAFVSSYRFERLAGDRIGFLAADASGELRYDPSTFHIVQWTRRAAKGRKSFSLEMQRHNDGTWLPMRAESVEPHGKDGTARRVTVYSNYRRFAPDSSVRFEPRP